MPASPPVPSPPLPSTSDHKVLVTSSDTTNAYLAAKIASSTSIAASVLNPGANEQVKLDLVLPVSSPGAGANSESFGASSTAAGASAFAGGYNCHAAGLQSTAIGESVTAPGPRDVGIGAGVFFSGSLGLNFLAGFGCVMRADAQSSICISDEGTGAGVASVGFGRNINIGLGADHALCMGDGAVIDSAVLDGIAHGTNTHVTGNLGIALGKNALAAGGQFVVGATTAAMSLFRVRGAGGVDPIFASNDPADVVNNGDTGLKIAAMIGGSIVSRQLKFDPVTSTLFIENPAPTVANWAVGTVRYFACSPSGNDANLGWSDASLAAVQPVQTLAKLLSIIPKVGVGRTFVAAVAPGTYSDPLYVNDFSGYPNALIRCSDLTNSASDKIVCGAVQSVPGPNGDGSWTITAVTDAYTFTIGAGTFSAEPGILGDRVRFAPNTTTVALQNAVSCVHTNTSTVITVLDQLPATPAIGDHVFIEEPGAVVPRIRMTNCVSSNDQTGMNSFAVRPLKYGITVVGFKSTLNTPSVNDNTIVSCQRAAVSFVKTAGFVTMSENMAVTADTSYVDETNTSIKTGAGLTAGNVVEINNTLSVDMVCYAKASQNGVNIAGANHATYQGFCSAGTGNSYIAVKASGSHENVEAASLGFGVLIGTPQANFSTRKRMRGIVSFTGSCGAAVGLDVTGTSGRTIVLASKGSKVYADDIAGTMTGGGLVAWAQGRNVLLRIGSSITCTGQTNDLQISTAVLPITDLAVTNVVDQLGNQIWSGSTDAKTVAGPGILVTNQTGSSTAPGDVVRSNGTSGQVVKAQADTAGDADGPLLVMLTTTANAAAGYAVPLAQSPWVNFDGTPTVGVAAYLSPGTAGKATTTTPTVSGTNRRRLLGYVHTVSGTTARLSPNVDAASVYADGAAGPGVQSLGRTLFARSANVAGASTFTVGAGNMVIATGTTGISFISTTGWTGGTPIYMYIQDGLTVANLASSPPANTANIKLVGGADAALAAGSTLTLIYDDANAWFKEIARTGA